MLKADAIKRETELMNALHNEFSQMEYDVERTGAEENGIGDLLNFDFEAGINNEPVLASVFFLPIKEEEVSDSYFVQSLTLTDEIAPDEKKLEMLQAVNVLNYNIPYGSFLFDTDINILSYKIVTPVDENMKREDALNYILRQSMIGFGIVSLYIAAINALLEDRITWEEFVIAIAELLKEGEE